MSIFFTASLFIFLLWVLASLKTSRPDGTLVKNLHPYRRLLSFIQPNADSSVVYFDEYVKADNLLKFLEESREESQLDMTQCLVAASGLAMMKHPFMNRFVKGYRLYQRNETYVSFTMKRKKLNKKAKVSAVKMQIKPDMTLSALNEKIKKKINVERSNKKTSFDVEANLFFKLPRPLMYFALKFAMFLDYYNLLPSFMIKSDAMYTSVFMANLGSLGMKSGYHHLYEWGSCPHFITLGKVFDRPIVKDGKVTFEKSINVRFSFDERIEDGFTAYQGVKTLINILEEPKKHLSGLNQPSKEKITFADVLKSMPA